MSNYNNNYYDQYPENHEYNIVQSQGYYGEQYETGKNHQQYQSDQTRHEISLQSEFGYRHDPISKSSVFDPFSTVNNPDEYLNAPSRNYLPSVENMANSSFDTSLDASFHEEIMDAAPQDTYAPIPIDPSSHFEISPLVNQNDQVSINFLIQSAMVESKGFKILSYQDIDPLKKQLTLLKSRQSTIRHKLELESKVSDAASSLAKLHLNSTAVIDTNTNVATSSSAFRRRSAAVSSLFSGNSAGANNKRLSKHAKDEYEMSLKKMSELKDELTTINERVSEIEIALLQHSVALLGWTHSGSITVKNAREDQNDTMTNYHQAVSRDADILTSLKPKEYYPTDIDNNPKVLQQTSNMTELQHQDNQTPIDTFQVDELINDISKIIDNEEDPISIKYDKEDKSLSMQDKLTYLVTICHHFFYNYRDIKQQFADALEKNQRLIENHEGAIESDSTLKLSDYNTEINDLRELLQTTQRSLKVLEIENMDLKSSQKDIDLESQYENEINNLRKLLASTESELERLQLDNADLQLDNADLKSIHRDLNAQSRQSKYEDEIISLKKSLAETEAELEKVELEHVNLKSLHRDLSHKTQLHASQLKNMAISKEEIMQEWKERHDSLLNELKLKSSSLDDLVKQNADYKLKQANLNAQVVSLQDTLSKSKSGTNANEGDRFTGLFLTNDSNTNNASATILVREFKRITEEMRLHYLKELKNAQEERRKLDDTVNMKN